MNYTEIRKLSLKVLLGFLGLTALIAIIFVLSGDFGGNVLLGYKVENGEMVGRVKDTMISGNVYQVLKELLAIGRESRWVDGILQTPPLYCPCISVATKGR